ncbi:hypothetical protein QWY86_09425 [Pedobacter aquatilis]|uniref:hypothetical protein n=1 Tax=Pedobacter aquatilis TaxID=351343 RepID=UPI0025B4F4AF|nr:hypothetical protein [Pedobacter aquatilis]MDN3586887.1 hypothetical protein [Pedobacter aquatilis]
MKTLLFLLMAGLLFFNAPPKKKHSYPTPVATCYGKSNCTACSNCSGCKHCNAGGTCGVCSRPKSTTINTFSSSKTQQAAVFMLGNVRRSPKKEQGVNEVRMVMAFAGNMGNNEVYRKP